MAKITFTNGSTIEGLDVTGSRIRGVGVHMNTGGKVNPDDIIYMQNNLKEHAHAILQIADKATAGPWYVRFLNDYGAMNLTTVSTKPDTACHERWPGFDESEIVAATLVQAPRYADIGDGKWDENAQFIASARLDVPALCHALIVLAEGYESGIRYAEHTDECLLCRHELCAEGNRLWLEKEKADEKALALVMEGLPHLAAGQKKGA